LEPSLRTLLVILIGISVLFVCIAVASALNKGRASRPIDGAMIFVWLWLGFVIVDCYVGVRAGHGLALELALHALAFALPAGLAWYLSRRHRTTRPPAAAPLQE
jgi:hypothetical protein